MTIFTLAEKNLMVIYNIGSRLRVIAELGKMLKDVAEDETELHDITVSVIQKLLHMTDAEFAVLDLAPDMMKKDW